jgi:hypothetical protein
MFHRRNKSVVFSNKNLRVCLLNEGIHFLIMYVVDWVSRFAGSPIFWGRLVPFNKKGMTDGSDTFLGGGRGSGLLGLLLYL